MPLRARFFLALAASSVLNSAAAVAQPNGWTLDHTLSVMNLATGNSLRSFTVPENVSLGNGIVSADGRFYLASTSLGIARFSTATREFVGLFGPAIDGALTESPLTQRLHLVSGSTHRVLNAVDGSVLSQELVANTVGVILSPDGTTRYEIHSAPLEPQSTIRAFDERTDTPLWARAVTGRLSQLSAATPTSLVATSLEELVVLDGATGDERTRLAMSVAGLACCHDDAVVISTRDPVTGRGRLARMSLSTLQVTTVVVEPTTAAPSDVVLSSDGTLAYWQRYSIFRVTRNTDYRVIVLNTGEFAGGGRLSSFVKDLDVEPVPACHFEFPMTLSVGPQGGLVELPVSPVWTCAPWSAHDSGRGPVAILNPGPHDGAATLRLAVRPTTGSAAATFSVEILGRFVEITQAATPPPAPEASVAVREGRAVVSWTIGVGALPTEFVVRGGPRGGAPIALATVPVHARTWISSSLPHGSYSVEVIARNVAGDSPPSNSVDFSYNDDRIPDAPTALTAVTADDTVRLSWLPAAAGAAPNAYLLEVAGDNDAFVPLFTVESPHAETSRVPVGTWRARVRALSAGGASEPSETVTILSARCTSAPSAPTLLEPMAVAGVVTLRWHSPPSGGVEDYIVEAVTAPSGGSVRLPISGAVQVYEAAAPPGLYLLRLRARNACGESVASNEVVAYVP